ncbi:hypothetical protein MesoLjLc_75080 [Mesorhizobium sp. L-8-10]|uniref:ubiquinone biosynthesis methyltransferase UbiE n=1 Tax=unclassified Mesorhizobium TaxID=325217 RepID=UPI0019265620|nr:MULTISPECIES: ubiquinone biosynthesis methyltransferase UbiE [unclassified Mesorhizobium]BCH27624.1 hypothetical protein MesoLjLb_74090 [Mesorhizobium sp. L-8-3]BCH35578.1 hypothetical protein MesoLjLc_75080 [Mesorhizobium sp. L-8-10]
MQGTESGFELLLELDMDIGVFCADWSYCDRISSYVAQMISHNRIDSLLYSNLFSSALNELLETAYRAHGPNGRFACRVSRCGELDRIELTIPCEGSATRFYLDASKRLARPDVAEQYRSALFSPGPLEPDIGLFELAVDYDAVFRIDAEQDNAIRLVADLSLEDTRL